MQSGDLISNRYLLEDRLGKGGMGQVWRARDQRLERTVALKLIAPEFADEPELLVRFLREAQSIARISHPNVVAVLDFGEAEERPFLVMEYVPGKSLSDVTGDPMYPENAAAIIAQAADGAGAAHAQGIVHRDIKPPNVVLTDEGRAKLVDFGIASLQDSERLTATGSTIGSPHYISPEQAMGEKATPRSDVYSLGVVLYELLTGIRPFEGDSVAAIAQAHIDRDPTPPAQHTSDVDPRLNDLVLKCLSKDPARRFADGRALARALSPNQEARTLLLPAAAGDHTLAMAPVAAASDTYAGEPPPLPSDEPAWRPILIGLLIGLALIGAALGAIYLFLNERDEPRQQLFEDRGRRETQPAVPVTEPIEEETEPTETQTPTETPTPTETETEDEDDKEEDEDEDGEPEGRGPEGEGPPGHEDDGQ